jgi:2-enoate reductase
LRGHDVTLYEKNSQLGGHLIEGTVPSFKEDLRSYKDWLINQVKKLGVNIKLGEEVTPQIVDSIKPDAIVLATGSTPSRPNIPGIGKPNVTTAIDILLGKAEPGNETIVAGGGAVGCEAALYLAQQGKKVTIVEMLPDVASDVLETREVLTARLIDTGVEILTDLKLIEINDDGVTALSRDQEMVKVAGDKVALAMGMVAQDGLHESLKGKAPEVYLIGDAATPARVGEATRDGYRIGNTL